MRKSLVFVCHGGLAHQSITVFNANGSQEHQPGVRWFWQLGDGCFSQDSNDADKFVKSPTYGDYIRRWQSTHKKTKLNKAVKASGERLQKANVPAKIFQDAVKGIAKGLSAELCGAVFSPCSTGSSDIPEVLISAHLNHSKSIQNVVSAGF